MRLCSSKSQRYDNYNKAPYIVSSYPYFLKENLCQVSIHFLPLTYNKTNPKELYNQDLEVEVTTNDIRKEDRFCVKS